MTSKFPCGICAKAVAKSYNDVCCDICNLWVHIKYNQYNNVLLHKTSTESRIMVLSKMHKTSTTFFKTYL